MTLPKTPRVSSRSVDRVDSRRTGATSVSDCDSLIGQGGDLAAQVNGLYSLFAAERRAREKGFADLRDALAEVQKTLSAEIRLFLKPNGVQHGEWPTKADGDSKSETSSPNRAVSMTRLLAIHGTSDSPALRLKHPSSSASSCDQDTTKIASLELMVQDMEASVTLQMETLVDSVVAVQKEQKEVTERARGWTNLASEVAALQQFSMERSAEVARVVGLVQSLQTLVTTSTADFEKVRSSLGVLRQDVAARTAEVKEVRRDMERLGAHVAPDGTRPRTQAREKPVLQIISVRPSPAPSQSPPPRGSPVASAHGTLLDRMSPARHVRSPRPADSRPESRGRAGVERRESAPAAVATQQMNEGPLKGIAQMLPPPTPMGSALRNAGSFNAGAGSFNAGSIADRPLTERSPSVRSPHRNDRSVNRSVNG